MRDRYDMVRHGKLCVTLPCRLNKLRVTKMTRSGTQHCRIIAGTEFVQVSGITVNHTVLLDDDEIRLENERVYLRRDFHWLPIRQRIVYKQCLMTYKAVHIGQPNYLNELIQPYQPVRTLRSFISALLVIPFVRSDFASDAFSVSAPTLRNNLSQDVRSCANQATFKSRLKSHLFSLAFIV